MVSSTRIGNLSNGFLPNLGRRENKASEGTSKPTRLIPFRSKRPIKNGGDASVAPLFELPPHTGEKLEAGRLIIPRETHYLRGISVGPPCVLRHREKITFPWIPEMESRNNPVTVPAAPPLCNPACWPLRLFPAVRKSKSGPTDHPPGKPITQGHLSRAALCLATPV